MFKRFLIALGLLVLASPVSAFDGSRQGLILGLGIGDGGVSFHQKLSGAFTQDFGTEDKGAFQTDVDLGWGFSKQLLIYYANHVNWFRATNVFGDPVTIAHNVSTAAVSYFFSPSAPAFVAEGGVGVSGWDNLGGTQYTSTSGFGVWGGAGYEFSRHWLLRGKVTHGSPSKDEDDVKLETQATSFSISINYLAY